MKDFVNKKAFHICMITVIIAVILFIVGILVLRYNVKGETNLPFNLSKIVIVSTSEGINKENTENKWAMDINQNNDIYLYIEKNDRYNETETIEKITLDNFVITRNSEIGTQKIYKPNENETVIFKNTVENETQTIEYTGDLESNIKQIKISNQGGLVVFRYSLDQVGEYLSNDGEEVSHSELLKKININNEDLKASISFDITIKLNSGKAFKATVTIDVPNGNVVENGTVNQEITNLNDIVFKRIENV